MAFALLAVLLAGDMDALYDSENCQACAASRVTAWNVSHKNKQKGVRIDDA